MIKKRLVNLFLSATMIVTMITPTPFVKADSSRQVADINESLIGYWNFDSGALSNLVDNNKNGELIGSNISIKDSDMGKALHFGNDSNSYMKVPQFINSGTTSYSISMWYKYDTNIATNKNTVLVQQDGSGRSLLLLTNDNKYRTFVNASNVDSNTTVDKNLWQLFPASFSESNFPLI